MTYTIEELVGMDDGEFHKAVVNDIAETTGSQGAFQSPEVAERTLAQLVEWLWLTNMKIEDRAEDPDCPAELYEKTVKFRSHLLSAISVTERRIEGRQGATAATVRKWKAVLDEVIAAILDGQDDADILAIRIPSFDGLRRIDMPSLEEWHEIRRAKDPARYEAMKASA